MKTILLGLFSMVVLNSFGQEQKNKTVTATFNGYEEGVYYFSNGDDDSYDFEKIDAKVLKVFNLKSEKFVNKKFKITYKEEKVEDEDGEEYEIWVIIKLELVKK